MSETTLASFHCTHERKRFLLADSTTVEVWTCSVHGPAPRMDLPRTCTKNLTVPGNNIVNHFQIPVMRSNFSFILQSMRKTHFLLLGHQARLCASLTVIHTVKVTRLIVDNFTSLLVSLLQQVQSMKITVLSSSWSSSI